MRSVIFVELTASEKIIPLASAYLQSYARADPEVAGSFSFQIMDRPAPGADPNRIAAELAHLPCLPDLARRALARTSSRSTMATRLVAADPGIAFLPCSCF